VNNGNERLIPLAMGLNEMVINLQFGNDITTRRFRLDWKG